MRVLLVEDEVVPAAYLKRGLERTGYAVDVASDGEQGLWLASTQPYDAIVLDIMLPRLDGLEVCARLRRDGVWTPILMLTARDRAEDEVNGLDIGADDYLTKPFAFAVLLARLRALVRRGAPERPAALEFGDLRLDPAGHRATVGGVPLALTATETCLMTELLRAPGALVAKRDFLGACWDWAFDGDPNIVEVYIRRIRKKLAAAGSSVSIATIRTAGYRLEADG